jgi:hypothetical protein
LIEKLLGFPIDAEVEAAPPPLPAPLPLVLLVGLSDTPTRSPVTCASAAEAGDMGGGRTTDTRDGDADGDGDSDGDGDGDGDGDLDCDGDCCVDACVANRRSVGSVSHEDGGCSCLVPNLASSPVL